MSDIIDVARGSHKQIVLGKTPYVTITGVSDAADDDSAWLLSDFRIHLGEKNSIIQCFNDINHIYAFGHDPENSTFSLVYLVFLGKKCMPGETFEQADTLDTKFITQYVTNKLSADGGKTVKITLGIGRVLTGIELGFDVSVYDEEMHIASATIGGKIVEYK